MKEKVIARVRDDQNGIEQWSGVFEKVLDWDWNMDVINKDLFQKQMFRNNYDFRISLLLICTYSNICHKFATLPNNVGLLYLSLMNERMFVTHNGWWWSSGMWSEIKETTAARTEKGLNWRVSVWVAMCLFINMEMCNRGAANVQSMQIIFQIELRQGKDSVVQKCVLYSDLKAINETIARKRNCLVD